MKVSIKTILRLCCYISLAISFLPVVDYYCPWYVTMLPLIAVLFFTLHLDKGITKLVFSFLYITGLAVLILWYVRRKEPLITYFVNFYITFMPAMLAVQLGKVVEDNCFFRDYLRALMLMASITCVTTMIGHTVYPMASRELASGTALYDTEKYLKMNIGGYDFIYALVVMIPVFLRQARQEAGVFKWLYTAALVLAVLCIYSSQYTIALICTFATFLIAWAQKTKKRKTVITIVAVVFFLFNGMYLLSQLFYWAAESIPQEYLSDRLLQVAQLLSGREVDTQTSTERIIYYQNELTVFKEYFLFGKNIFSYHKSAVSGHSLILDMLGAGGIFATVIMLVLFRCLYKVSVPVSNQKASNTVNTVWTVATMIAILNPVTFPAIATVVFLCCKCIERLEKGDM